MRSIGKDGSGIFWVLGELDFSYPSKTWCVADESVDNWPDVANNHNESDFVKLS
jgi:hypothetical protein